MRSLIIRICHAAALASLAIAPSLTAREEPVHQGFDMKIPYAPSPVPVGDRILLVHELHLTNFAANTLTLHRLLVTDAEAGTTIGDLQGEALANAIAPITPASPDKTSVAPGATVVLYLDMQMPTGNKPGVLQHRLSYSIGADSGAKQGTADINIAVDDAPLPVLSPPLRGGAWTAVYDPALERGHRQVVYAVDGKARIPGRFAIDWMADGHGKDGIATDGLGAEVLAVADGVVASTLDGVPEPVAGQPRPQVGMAQATGNYVSIAIGGGKFAFYEHLMPGLLVEPGQVVRRGQVIGKLGSTGQAWRPHLHFHLASADSPLAAEGLPYVLEGYHVLGSYPSIAAFQRGEQWEPSTTVAPGSMFPSPNVVVTFGCDGRPERECGQATIP